MTIAKCSLRQFFIEDLGHEEPTILLTNQRTRPVKQMITRYAQRMLIENALSDAVRFFHPPVVEKHYVAMRSRRQPSILAFLAQDAGSNVFCYSNADLRKGEEAEEAVAAGELVLPRAEKA